MTNMEDVAKNAISDITNQAIEQIQTTNILNEATETIQRLRREISGLRDEKDSAVNCMRWLAADREIRQTNTTIILNRLIKENAKLKRHSWWGDFSG